MEVKELQEKLLSLSGYLEGLKQLQKETEKAIHKTERDIRRACKHNEGMQYVVGTEPSYDPDDCSTRYHCQFCDVCQTLFVIKEFGYCEQPKQPNHQTVGLNGLFSSFFVDRTSMREDR